VPPDDYGPLDDACARVATFDWIIFSSAVAVDAFIERLLPVLQCQRGVAQSRPRRPAQRAPRGCAALDSCGKKSDRNRRFNHSKLTSGLETLPAGLQEAAQREPK
jgi:hypothetical protein